jgi:putative NADPH-quinone reductase
MNSPSLVHSSQAIRILVIVAGTNEPSNADYLADCFIEGLKQANATTEKVRLRDLTIEHFSLSNYDPTHSETDDVPKLRTMLNQANGIVFASPIWNFSVPAHLKNFIDRMGSFALDQESHSLGMLQGKPFFLLYTGGTPLAAWRPLQKKTVSHLPTSIRYFGGAIIGMHYEGRCTPGKGKFGLVVDKRPNTIALMRERGAAFARATDLFARTGKLPWKEAWALRIWRIAQGIKRKLGI